MSEAKPSGPFLESVQMAFTAILVDGGYLLKHLPHVRPDVDENGAGAVAASVNRLVFSHLKQVT